MPGEGPFPTQDRALVDQRQRLDRARGADTRLETGLADGVDGPPRDRLDLALHLLAVFITRRIVPRIPVRETHDAQREALRQQHTGPIGHDELGRAAADVD